LRIAQTTFSNLRARRGWPRRNARDAELIPWAIKPEHHFGEPLWALRAEARLRSGMEMRQGALDKLAAWKDRQFHDGLVIHYDPDTEQGWWLVPRREGVDMDMIREPQRPTTERRPRA